MNTRTESTAPTFEKLPPIFPKLDVRRASCILLDVEVVRSNANGDPDNENQPRQTPFGFGFISAVSARRVVRDYVKDILGHKLYIDRDSDLGATQDAYKPEADAPDAPKGKKGKGKGTTDTGADSARMLTDLWDLAVYGGTLTQVKTGRKPRGSCVLSDLQSIDPVEITSVGITRVATHGVEKEAPDDSEETDAGPVKKRANMGRYYIAEYGIYRGVEAFNPIDAYKNGMTQQQAHERIEAYVHGFAFSRSAQRQGVNPRAVYLFQSKDGRMPEVPERTKNRIQYTRNDGGAGTAPSGWINYDRTIDMSGLPAGMVVYAWEDGVVREYDSTTGAWAVIG